MQPAPPTFSLSIFALLVLMFASSMWMFFTLVRRWTTQRQWASLSQWTAQRGFKFDRSGVLSLPAQLQSLEAKGAAPLMHLSDENHDLIQLETNPPSGRTIRPQWHLLVRRRQLRGVVAPAALRPVNASSSILDLLGLAPYPSLSAGNRFAVLASSSTAARALANSSSRTLIPADLGFFVGEDAIVIDFSSRPFDPITLDRLLALADQMAQLV